MLILRCCTVLVALAALAIGGVLVIGRKYEVTKGMIPALVVNPQISFDTVPDLTGKTIVVTGANSGLGYSAVKHFAVNGAETVMVCRSMEKCNLAKKQILRGFREENKYTGKIEKNLIPMEADLGSFKSIKKFGELMNQRFQKIHSLVLNAGVAGPVFALTEDGIEQTIGVNHFGHFYMTQLLLPLVEKAEPSTIVVVSSAIHYSSYPEGVRLSIDAINDKSKFEEMPGYGQSKLANILFAQELSDRLSKAGKKVFVNSVHPGMVHTEIIRHQSQLLQDVVSWVVRMFPNTIVFESDYAALVEVYAAVSEDIFAKEISGKYFVPIGEQTETSPDTKNITLQKGLWKLSENVLKEKGLL